MTNAAYAELIRQLLSVYMSNFEQCLVHRSQSEAIAISQGIIGEPSDVFMRLGIGNDEQLAEAGFASAQCRYLRVEQVLTKLFQVYNREKDEQKGGSAESNWLCETLWALGKAGDRYDTLMQITALSMLAKVYYDAGSKLLVEKRC